MRYAWMLILALGCAPPTEPSAPLPPEMVDAILNPAPDVPPPPKESPLGSAVGSAFDSYLESATSTPAVEVEMLTATWCGPCKTAHAKVVPWLRAKGYTVHETDVSDFSADDLHKAYGVKGLPTFIFRDGKTHAKVTGPRYDTKGNPYAPDFAAAIAAFPPPAQAVSSFGMPTIELSEFSHLVAGQTFEFGSAAQLIVPANVTWTATPKPASVLLTFPEGRRPQLQIRKFIVIRMNPQILSVEIGPNFIELKTDSSASFLATARLNFDWSAPPATKTPVKKTAGNYTRFRQQPYRYQPQYRPVPQVQKPKPPVVVAEPEPTPAPPEPITLGKSCPVVVQVAHTYRASVCIWLKRDCTVYDIFGVPSVKEGKGCGSGMIVSANGYILTCAHVVDDVKSIEVEFCDGQKRPARLIEADKKTDLAILKVEGVDLPSVTWAKESPMVGADAWMVGNPHGRGESVARGIVAGFGREVESEDYNHKGLTHVSIVINPGNSGGPVVNSKGECFGVINAMVGDHGGLDAQGIAFCIPFSRAVEFVNKTVKP